MGKQRAKLNNLLEKTIEEEVNNRVKEVLLENEQLNSRVQTLVSKVSDLTFELDNLKHDASQSLIMFNIINQFKDKMYTIEDKEKREQLVYKLLESFFDKDFVENTIDCPLWLGACTQFYSHKDDVVKLLKALEIYVPENIDKFRLPHEYTTDELAIIFATMNNHYACNGCIYEDNLRYWKPNALDDVYSVCYGGLYTEIPWQFLLRNPNLLQEKYLKKIGKMAFEAERASAWGYFFKIQQYQELTPQQIKTIIENMNPYHTVSSSKFNTANEFLLKNAQYIPEGPLLESFYECFRDSYDFRYHDIIIKLPAVYLEDWIRNVNNPLEWIERNKNKLNKSQKDKLIKIVLEDYLE